MKELDDLLLRYPNLMEVKSDILTAYDILVKSYEAGGKLLIAGNGGSACDADHIVGELMKGFRLERRVGEAFQKKIKEIDVESGDELSKKLQGALPAISLTAHTGAMTAVGNDTGYDMAFAQMLYGYADKEDVLLAITTSGNSKNIINAAIIAKALDIKIVGLTGGDGGKLKKLCDVCIQVPSTITSEIQDMHLPIYHTFCIMLENKFFES